MDLASQVESARAPAEIPSGRIRQKLEFRSGNEAAALAARDIGYHLMGYFPITPSTEVAENLSKMQAEGQHEIVMVAGDGEHGAAGICYGAALGGGRVLNATSSQGLLYALEQLPVQARKTRPWTGNPNPTRARQGLSTTLMQLSLRSLKILYA